jgi:hypothetical protein
LEGITKKIPNRRNKKRSGSQLPISICRFKLYQDNPCSILKLGTKNKWGKKKKKSLFFMG